MRAYLGTYHAEVYYSDSRPHKCQMRNYVSNSAENGPAMAGPAGPIPVPMIWLVTASDLLQILHIVTTLTITA